MARHAKWWRVAGAAASGLLVAGTLPPLDLTPLAWLSLLPMLGALWTLDGARAGSHGFLLGWLGGTVTFACQFWWLGIVSPLGVVVLPLYLGLFWGLFGAYAATLANGQPKERRSMSADAHGKPISGASAHPIARSWTSANMFRRSLARNMTRMSPREGWSECARSLRHAFCLGAVWAGLEWLRGWLFTGFGWNPLGVAFHETLALAQAADLLGVSGLSLLLVFFQAVLLQAGKRVALSARDGIRRPRHDFLIAAAVVVAVICYGVIRITSESRREAVRLKALLVQINIPQDAARVLWEAEKVHMAYEEETLHALDALADTDAARLREAADGNDEGEISLSWPDWVIWPESALTGRFLRTADGTWGTWRENLETIARVREAGPFTLIHGAVELEAVEHGEGELMVVEKGRAWNSLVVMNPQDELQTYRKRHLVIFGETIPFVDTIPWLKKLYEQQAGIEYGGSFTPGESTEPLSLATASGRTISAIPTICFEDTLGRLVRRFARPAPQVIVNVTNDGWFKESPAAAQHFANARFRAIELRRPMLRAANTGVSAALDSSGSAAHPDSGKPQVITDASGSHFARGSLLAELDVPLQPGFSLYALIGDWGVIVLALGALGGSFFSRYVFMFQTMRTTRPAV